MSIVKSTVNKSGYSNIRTLRDMHKTHSSTSVQVSDLHRRNGMPKAFEDIQALTTESPQEASHWQAFPTSLAEPKFTELCGK
jgi:hypothetical protein